MQRSEPTKSTYKEGSTARVIAILNGGKAALKNLTSEIKNEAIRNRSEIGNVLYAMRAHIPPLTTDIGNTISEIKQQLDFLGASKSKLTPLLTDQANGLFADSAALEAKGAELETSATQIVKSLDDLYQQVAMGNITPQKMLDELKKINASIKPIQNGIEKLENDLEAAHQVMNKFRHQILNENNAAKVASMLQPTTRQPT